MWLLRDPLELSDQQLIMPAPLAPVLMFCDGTRTMQEIHHAFCQHVNQSVGYDIIAQAIQQLDSAYLLENGRSDQARQAVREAYRAQPYRLPALAELSYPGDPAKLAQQFANYGAHDNRDDWQSWTGQAIVSPHIDYQRGGSVYAKVWERAAAAVLEADMVIMFGTDHNGGRGTFTLTRQAYGTPFGVLPTDTALIDKLADAIGPEEAFAEELHHRKEHAIELSAVWLHYIYHKYGVEPKPMIPILCGSFYHFVHNGEHPGHDELLMTAIETLKQETAGKKVLTVASVDFAHVGPTFGDEFYMDATRRQQLRKQDHKLIDAVLEGNADSFYNQIAAVQDSNRVCGFSPIYLMLRYLEAETSGTKVAYDQCSADNEDNSLVSISGLLIN